MEEPEKGVIPFEIFPTTMAVCLGITGSLESASVKVLICMKKEEDSCVSIQ